MGELQEIANKLLAQVPADRVVSTRAYDLPARLRAGSGVLTEQHRLWLDGDANAWDDVTFSWALAGWNDIEKVLRQNGYTDCIFGPGHACPEESPVSCDGCLGDLYPHTIVDAEPTPFVKPDQTQQLDLALF